MDDFISAAVEQKPEDVIQFGCDYFENIRWVCITVNIVYAITFYLFDICIWVNILACCKQFHNMASVHENTQGDYEIITHIHWKIAGSRQLPAVFIP